MILKKIGLLVLTGTLAFLPQAIRAQDDKPLAPGWLSLDCCVGLVDQKIAEGKSVLENALGIGISGYFDTSYNWSSNRPRNPSNISLHYFNKDHDKVVFNNFHLAIEKPEKDWGVGFRISGDFGRTGELLREATLWGKTLQSESSAELREAYLTTTIPIGEGLQIKGGLFTTLLGTEIIPNPGAYNDNISRSFLFNLAIPFRHLGVLFTYPVHNVVSLTAGIVTGWDNPRDNNHTPSFLGSVSVTPNDKFSYVAAVSAGEEPATNHNTARFVISNVWTIKPVDPLALIVEYTYGTQNQASLGGTRDATWQGIAGIASYEWTDRFSTALRGEYFSDRDGARIGGDAFGTHANVEVAEFTLTGSYKFTKMLIGRAEVRQDMASRRVYAKGGSNADKNQTILGAQLLYTF